MSLHLRQCLHAIFTTKEIYFLGIFMGKYHQPFFNSDSEKYTYYIMSSSSTSCDDNIIGAIKVVDKDLIVSRNDLMNYRVIHLDNGLKAILVSNGSDTIDLNESAENAEEIEEKEEEEEEEEEEDEEEGESEDSSKGSDGKTSEDEKSNKPNPKVGESREKLAACALCVGVGSFSDPHDIFGLAHFLEHMVFMGSEKYPQENGFDEFIKRHGGSDNGSTDCELTTFYFECRDKYLREGIDRFAQFFISPLMKPEAMTREREIIQSEFEMSLPSDGSRQEQIIGSFAPAGHPAGKFYWGNLTTLSTNIDDSVLYERVQQFQKRHYSAHRMTVAVQARLPLDLLENYVRESFSDVPNNGLPPDDFSNFVGSYGTPETFNKLVWIKPVKELCQVTLNWILPPYKEEYRSKPLDYIAWLIGHEGEGSLLSLLRKKVWALRCTAGNDESGFEYNSIYFLFSISLSLTEEGYQHLNEVICLVFSYIAMLKKNCPNKLIYDELKTIYEINFRYKREIPAIAYVEILAESMHFYEPKHYVAGGELYFEYKPQIISDILNLLTPDRVNIIVHSSKNKNSFYDKVEPWFQTKYKVEDIPSFWLEDWLKCNLNEEFQIPKPNPYLTTDFSIIPGSDINPPYPINILNNDLFEIWYRQDAKFKEPLAYCYFYLVSSIFKSDPFNLVLLDFLIAYFEAKFSEKIFPANEAGLYCTYSSSDLGLTLKFNGYNEKLPLLFDEILILIHKCCGDIKNETNNDLFNAIKKQRCRSYYNAFIKPMKLVKMVRLSLLVESYWTALERLEAMKEVTLEKFHEFANTFLKSVKIIGLIQGNMNLADSIKLCLKFKTILQCSPLDKERPKIATMRLGEGEKFLRLESFSEMDTNSVITNYYQIGPANIKLFCLIDLLMMTMEEPLFDNLRTKQQIGYEISCALRDTFGILGFSITVAFQSQKFHPDVIDERIEEFLKNFLNTLKSMPKKEWEEVKETLCSLKNGSDLELRDEVERNFAEICTGEYIFDRLTKEVETIPHITKNELCDWFAEHTACGKKFKKLSVQVVGDSKETSDSCSHLENFDEKKFYFTILNSENEKKNLFITDIGAYKNAREYYSPRASA